MVTQLLTQTGLVQKINQLLWLGTALTFIHINPVLEKNTVKRYLKTKHSIDISRNRCTYGGYFISGWGSSGANLVPAEQGPQNTAQNDQWSSHVKTVILWEIHGNSRDLVKAWFPVPKTKTEIDGDFLPRSSFEGTFPDFSGKPKKYYPYMLHVWTSWSLFIDIYPEDINIFPQRYQHSPQRPENLWPVPVGPMQFPTVVGHSLDPWTVPCWEDPLQNPAVAS